MNVHAYVATRYSTGLPRIDDCNYESAIWVACSASNPDESVTKRLDTRAAESRDTMLAAHATPANGACDSRTTATSGRATAASAS